MLKIWGRRSSFNVQKVLWLAGELGLDYEHNDVLPRSPGTRTPTFQALNPNARVPVIEDDGFVLAESMAINLYLAKKHGKLYPSGAQNEALAWQWSFWGMTEVERPALTALLKRIGPESERDPGAADEAERALAAPLRVLDAAVATQPYLLGEHFTVADLNVASILSWARQARVDLSAFPKAAAWLKTCHDRPAAQAAQQLQRE